MKKLFALTTLALFVTSANAADWGLKEGSLSLKSASVLTMGPDNILFIGDTKAGSVVAVNTGEGKGDASSANITVENIATNLSDMLGGQVTINDMTASPTTGELFLACSASGKPSIVRVSSDGREMNGLDLSNVAFSSVELTSIPEDKVTGQGRRKRNKRGDAITDLAYYESKLLISGLRTKGSASSVREIEFPFADTDRSVGVQIYHAAHGREEDYSAMRTFVPMMIDGEPSLLGAYVCTPLVKIPLKDVASGNDVKATTVAELGNRNRPLDMVSYTKGKDNFLLLSNSARGVMKITTAGLSNNEGLTERVSGGGTAGQTYETIEDLQGVIQMAKLNDSHVAILVENDGKQHLKTVALP